MALLPEALAFLLLTHVIGDYALQFDPVYKLKMSGTLWGLAIHVAIHIIVAEMLLLTGGIRNWLLLALLFSLHFTIDLLKLQLDTRFQFLAYIGDQILHLGCLLLLFWLFPQTETFIPNELLTPLLLYSLVPFLTMTIWVWYSERQRRLRPDDEAILQKGFFGSMKRFSQYSAMPLLLGVIAWIPVQGVPLLELVMNNLNGV